MMEYANENGYSMTLFTTLVGLFDEQLERVLNISFKQIVLHISDKDGYINITVTDSYIKNSKCNKRWWFGVYRQRKLSKYATQYSNRNSRREKLRIGKIPQACRYGTILNIYNYGFENNIGIHDSSYANTLMADVDEELYFL